MSSKYQEIKNFNKLDTGEHTVLIYKKKSEYISASISFIKSCIQKNEKCLYILNNINEKTLISELQNYIVDLEKYLENKQLQFFTQRELSVLGNKYKENNLINFLKREASKSLDEGYNGLRITGELRSRNNSTNFNEDIKEYDWHLSKDIFEEYPITAMCRCNIKDHSNSYIRATIELHNYIIWNYKVHENPYYIDPEAYKNNRVIDYEIKSWLKNIQKYEKRESRFNKVLKNKEVEYEFLFNKINDGVFLHKIVDDDFGKFLKVNNKACEMLGYSEEELLNMCPKDLNYPKRDRSFYKNIIKEIKEKKEVYLEVQHMSSSGEIIPVELNINCYTHQGSDYLLAIVRDLSSRKEKERELIETKNELQIKNESLEVNNEEIRAINETLDESIQEIHELNARFIKLIDLFSNRKKLKYGNEKEYLTDILETAIKVIPEADYGSVYKYEDGKVDFISTKGFKLKELAKLDLPVEPFYNLNDEIEVINYDKIRNLNKKYLSRDDYFKLEKMNNIKEILRMDLKISGERKIGLNLDIDADSNKQFSGNSLSIFKAFHNIATSFYTIREYNYLQNSFIKELINSIIKLLEIHDIYTKGHSENVANLASKLAEKMGLSKKTVEEAYWTGLVHDMGKLLIPIDILNKPTQLTKEEYELIKKHPLLGSKALKNSDSLKHIAIYVKYHHERWDGKGYPFGLSGNEIPLVSQIIQIADSWDAMRSNRAYKKGLSYRNAVKEITSNKGTQFSPKVAEHFLKMLEEREFEIQYVR